jgi:hypothetical protein
VRGRGGRKEEKRGGRLELLSRSGAMRRRRAGEREPGSRAVGRKGKADGWDPPVSCPGRKEGEASRQIAMVGWAGRAGWFVCGERKGRGEECSWAWVAWASGLVVHEGY